MNFFYDELNNLANINAATDESDDEVILGTFDNDATEIITGNVEESYNEANLIYGKLNKEVEPNTYKGSKTSTAITTVDNATNTILVDVDFNAIDNRFATDEALTSEVARLDSTIESNYFNLQNEFNTKLNTAVGTLTDGLLAEQEARLSADEILKTSLDIEIQDRKDAILELENTINNEIKESLDTMQGMLDQEVIERTEAIKELENTINNNILTKLDTTVLQDTTISYDKDNVSLVNSYINLSSEVETLRSNTLTLANDNQAGLMAIADYRSLRNLEARVGNLEGKTTRLLYTAKKKPTAEDIQAFIDAIVNEFEEPEYSHPYEGLSIVVDETYHVWHYYENDNIGWKDDGVDTVHVFTNETSGIIKGSAIDGKIYAETDGTGSVFGWSELKTRVSNNESAIESNYNALYANLPRVYRLAEV